MKNLLKKLIPTHEFVLWLIPTVGAVVFVNAGSRYDTWFPYVGILVLVATSIMHRKYLEKWYIDRSGDNAPEVIREVHYQDLADQIRNQMHDSYPDMSKDRVDLITDKMLTIIKREL